MLPFPNASAPLSDYSSEATSDVAETPVPGWLASVGVPIPVRTPLRKACSDHSCSLPESVVQVRSTVEDGAS